MKKLIWRLRYAVYWAKMFDRDFRSYKMGWEFSGIHIQEGRDWMDDTPESCVDEELTYWVD